MKKLRHSIQRGDIFHVTCFNSVLQRFHFSKQNETKRKHSQLAFFFQDSCSLRFWSNHSHIKMPYMAQITQFGINFDFLYFSQISV